MWLIHPSLVFPADVSLAAKLYRDCTYYATSYDDMDIREIVIQCKGKVGPEQLFSYPYVPTVADEAENSSVSSEDSGGASVRPRGKRLRTLHMSKTSSRKRHQRVRTLLRSISSERRGSFFTLSTLDTDGQEYIAVSPVHRNQVALKPLINGIVDTSSSPRLANFDYLARHGVPSILHPSGTVLKSAKRTGSRGFFHLRYGYIAEDEAPPEMIETGRFDTADLKEWSSILENNVLGPPTHPPEGVRPCRTRFRRT